MGTDIHGVFQRYDEASKSWLDIESNYTQDRDYYLFSILAGVRYDDVAPIAKPRGLPSDFERDWDYHPVNDARYMDPDSRIDYPYHKEFYERSDEFQGRRRLNMWMGDHSYSWLTGQEMLDWFKAVNAEAKEATAYFFDEVARLAAEHGVVRFVFGFDS